LRWKYSSLAAGHPLLYTPLSVQVFPLAAEE
jgi:hypothetical protein